MDFTSGPIKVKGLLTLYTLIILIIDAAWLPYLALVSQVAEEVLVSTFSTEPILIITITKLVLVYAYTIGTKDVVRITLTAFSL